MSREMLVGDINVHGLLYAHDALMLAKKQWFVANVRFIMQRSVDLKMNALWNKIGIIYYRKTLEI